MKNILLTVVTLFLVSCASHDKQNKHYHTKIAASALKKDVAFTKKRLVNMHPDLYWYISKSDLDKKFDSLANNLKEPLTPNEFYLKISPVVASVHQGHMSMSMVNLTWPDSLKKKYKRSIHPLQHFEYEYLDNKLFVKRNKSKTDTLQVGTEIVDINGITPTDLFQKYHKTLTSDGYNQTAIPKFFARRINSFYSNELGFVDSVTMKVRCAEETFHHTVKRTFKGKEKDGAKVVKKETDTLKQNITAPTDTIAKLSKKERKIRKKALKKAAQERYKKYEWFGYDTETKTFSKEIVYPINNDSTVAVLKIRDFSKGKIKVYDTIFSELKKHNVQNLIIDLRGNPGGRINDVYKLAQYLNDSTFTFTQPATITKRTTFFNILRGKKVVQQVVTAPFITIFAGIRGFSATRDDKGELKMPMQSSKLKKPNQLNYTNKLYVVTDGMTFSAAALISSHLKGRERAFFVGDETGGTFNGTVAGVMPVVKLPHSKLRLRLGLMTIKPTQQTKEEGYGVQPHVYIKPTTLDFLNDKDVELEWILNDIITKKNALN